MEELNDIIARMVEAGESEENIKLVAEAWKAKNAGKIPPPVTGAPAEETTAPDTELLSANISLDLASFKDQRTQDILSGYNKSIELTQEDIDGLKSKYKDSEELQSQAENLSNLKARNYMQGLDDDDRLYAKEALAGIVATKRAEFDTSKFVFDETLKQAGFELTDDGIQLNKDSQFSKNIKQLENMQSALRSARAKGQEPSQQFFDDYNSLSKSIQLQQQNLTNEFQKVKKSFEQNVSAYSQIGAATDIVDNFQRNWSEFDKTTQEFSKFLMSASAAVFEFAENGYVIAKAGGISPLPAAAANAQIAINTKDAIKDKGVVQNFLAKNAQGLTDVSIFLGEKIEDEYYKKLTWEQATTNEAKADYAVDTLLSNLPNTVAAIGGIGIPAMFFSAAGENIANNARLDKQAETELPYLKDLLEKATTQEEKDAINARIKDFENHLNSDEATRFLVATGYGTFEALTDKFFGDIALVDWIKKGGVAPDILKNRLGKYVSTFLFSQGMEVTGEEINTIAGNIMDSQILGKNVNIFDGVKETAIDSFIIGTGYGSVGNVANLTGKLVEVTQTRSRKKKFVQLHNDIKDLSEQLKNEDLTSKERKEIRSQMRGKAKELALETEFNLEQLGRFNSQELFELGESDRKLKELRKKALAIALSNKSKEQKEAEINEINDQYIVEAEAKENFILQNTGKTSRLRKQKTDKSLNDYISTASRINQLNADQQAVMSKEFAKLGIEIQFAENQEQANEIIQKSKKLSDKEKQSMNGNAAIFGNDKLIVINTSGSIADIIQNKSAFAGSVVRHEVLHGILFKSFDNSKIQEIGKKLEDYARAALQNGDTRYEKIVERIDAYRNAKNKNNTPRFSEATVLEEAWNAFSDIISDPGKTGAESINIVKDKTLFEEVKNEFNNFISLFTGKPIGDLRLDTAEDAIQFLSDYNKSFTKGQLSKGVKLALKQKGFKPVKTTAAKESLSTDEKTAMMNLYNKFMESVERTEYSKNKPLPARLENELVGKFYNYVSAVVNNQFRQVEEEAIEREDAVAILMGEVVSAIRTFDPAKNNDIAGYVANIIGRRKSMVFQDVNQEFTDNIETSKEAQAETEEISTDFSKKIQEVNKKINLAQGLDTNIEIEGKIYERHVKDALSKAVARAVKKINEDVSANRTITPFVESIKSDIATELRVITKAFINKYGYEEFLIDYKDLILNNLTTTYLSKHPLFRKGIEKSIGGKMSKDNQGNPVFEPNFVLPKETTANKFEWVDEKGNKAKIDRDNAGIRGLTSGPEIMRRSPKINTIITENEFVDYHFQDGALRKKKKQNPEDALAMQIASEISFDYLKDDFLNEKEIFSKAQEYGEVLGVIIADTQAEEIAKDFDRGVVKYSITSTDLGWLIDTATLDSSDEFLVAEVRKRYKDNKKKISQLIGFIEEGPLWLVKLAQVNKERNLGLVYEDLIGKILESANITELNIKVEGRFDNSAVDLIIERKSKPNQPIKIELKLNDKAQMSSFTINDIVNLDTSIDIPIDIKNAIEEALKDYNKIIDKYNKAATKKAEELGLEVIQPKTQGNNTLFVKTHADVFKAMQGDGFDGVSQKDLNLTIPLSDNINLVEFLYKSKGINYIQIGGKGLYFMGDNQADNVFNAPLLRESIKEIFITTRPTRSASNKFGIATLPYRAFPKFKGVDASYISLDNIKTVKNTLTSLAKYSLSTQDTNRINSMISETGKITKEEISEVTAARLGKTKGKFRFFIPPSADDFMGLMYYMLRQGKLGDQDLQFIKEKLIDPFTRAQANFDSYKIRTLNEFRQFKKLIRKIPKAKLSAKNDLGFTNEEAVRVYIWSKQNADIPGISKNEISSLVKLVEGNADLLSFANNVSNLLAGQGGYPAPQENWFGGSITIDVLEHINEISRKEFFAEFTEATEFFFGKLNNRGEISGPIANKLRAAYGDNYIEALSDVLYRMKNGRAREFGKNKLVNQFNNWISNSVGAVMFLNARSALLQQVSLVNFINLTDNNPIKFAAAIANPKQYWADYLALLNSDYLIQRRSGIKIDVNQDELVKAAESGRNPVQSVISLILKKGFVLTTWGDSHAIATGGAAFYRNRINTYLNDGLSETEAKEKAFNDFRELAEESQQSSRPDRISKQQASTLGRLILAWANTPMQYARITKKAALDLINGRGDWKTNMSKLVYYGAIQNIMFTYLQQGLFAMIFDGEDDEEKDADKYGFAFNSMADGFLRGIGFGGAVVATSKNMVLEAIDQAKGRGNYDEVVWEALKLSPPLGSKISKARAVGRTFGWKQEREKVFTEGFSLDNPAFEAVGKAVSATTNIPLDRVVRKLDNITYPMRHDVEFWQAAALYLGWGQWELGLKDVKKREKEKEKLKIKEEKYIF